jgi:hypothetical protein
MSGRLPLASVHSAIKTQQHGITAAWLYGINGSRAHGQRKQQHQGKEFPMDQNAVLYGTVCTV